MGRAAGELAFRRRTPLTGRAVKYNVAAHESFGTKAKGRDKRVSGATLYFLSKAHGPELSHPRLLYIPEQVRLTQTQRLREDSLDNTSIATPRDTFGRPHAGVDVDRDLAPQR
jgi:hypothetical protein